MERKKGEVVRKWMERDGGGGRRERGSEDEEGER